MEADDLKIHDVICGFRYAAPADVGCSFQVERIVRDAHEAGESIRVVGSALSPNGCGLSEGTMLSLGQCDRILEVDRLRGTVTVEVSNGEAQPRSHR